MMDVQKLVLLTLTVVTTCLASFEFSTHPESQAVVMGNELLLHCQVTSTNYPYDPGDPNNPDMTSTFEYTWLLNGRDISMMEPDAALFPNHTLYIPRVNESSLGAYECLVTDAENVTEASLTATVVEAYTSPFIISPKGAVVTEGEALTLECITGYSAPPAHVTWSRDGEEYAEGEQTVVKFGFTIAGGAEQRTSQLHWKEIALAQDGIYECHAVNPLSGASVTSQPATVTVKGAPYIVGPVPGEMFASEGLPLLLDCPVRPFESIFGYEWYWNTIKVRTVGSLRLLANGTLHIIRADRVDSGLYYCKAFSTSGIIVSPTVDVTIAYLDIQFVQPPLDVESLAGQDVTIPCRPPPSLPPATVQWYKGNSLIPSVLPEGTESQQAVGSASGGTRTQLADGSLHIWDIQLENMGEYSCEAVNMYAMPPSRTAPTITVSLGSSPILIQPPLPRTLVRGELLTLVCTVQGQPQPHITWYKDELILAGEEESHVTIRQGGQEVIIQGVSKHDEAVYYCVAENIYGRIYSATAKITVMIPPEMLSAMQDVTVTEATDAIFICPVHSDPPAVLTWYREDELVEASARHIYGDDTLTLLSVTRGQAGVYQCRANNPAGTATDYATLHINVPPEFLNFPGNRTVTMDTSVVLYCNVYGIPVPDVSWFYQDSSPLPSDTELSDSGTTLSIASVTRAHAGRYTCMASNAVGENHTALYLSVQEIPIIHEITGDTIIDLGKDLDLDCRAEGHPTPAITWSHGGEGIQETQDGRIAFPTPSRLLVRFVKIQDGGHYQCLATNPAGRRSNGVNIRIRGPPLPPSLDSVMPVSMTSLLLSWSPATQNSITAVTSFVIEYKIKFGVEFREYGVEISPMSRSLEVEGLRPATDYVFRMAARNHVGQGEYSAVVEGRTLEDAPSSPRALKIIAIDSVSATLQWEKPKVTNGEIRAYQLQHKQKYLGDYVSTTIWTPRLPLEQYLLEGLAPYMSYSVRVRAATINPSGTYLWGNFTPVLEMATMAAAPSTAPSNVQLLVTSSTSIQVTWQPILQGPVRGYKLTYARQDTPAPTIMLIEHAASQASISGLLPWQWYTLTLAAYNDIGTGPYTTSQRVRTLATAPVGYPQDVEVTVVSATSFQVSWKPVAVLERHSDISGYIVLYMRQGQVQGHSSYVNNPHVLHTTISDVSPWSNYTVQVQAFTTQVADGFGPLSPPHVITTLEDVPSAVPESTIQYSVSDTEILLKWSPVPQPNGKLLGYVIMYSVLNEESSSQEAASRKKRSSSTPTTVLVTQPEYSIQALLPSSQYTVAIAARTSAGSGPFTNLTVQTESAVEASSAFDEILVSSDGDGGIDDEVKVATTPARPAGASSEVMTGVIVGATLMGLLLVTVLVVLCVLCVRRRRHRRQQAQFLPTQPYVISATPPYHSSSKHRHVRQSVPYTAATTTSEDSTEYSPQSVHRSRQHQTSTPSPVDHYTRRHRHIHQQQREELEGHDRAVSSESQASSVTPVLMTRSGYGIDNPAYNGDSIAAAAAASTASLPPSQHALYPQRRPSGPLVVSKRRKMDRASAAAIAAQRDRNSSPFTSDTAQLIAPATGDNVVVYDERTAL